MEGLVYGYPHCGLANLDGVDNECDFKKYTGRNHVNGTLLNGRYFQYFPNEFYYDVEIITDRLLSLPIEESLLNLPSRNIDNVDDIPDDGPSKDQFDVLDVNEEIASYSGIVCPSDIGDADNALKKN